MIVQQLVHQDQLQEDILQVEVEVEQEVFQQYQDQEEQEVEVMEQIEALEQGQQVQLIQVVEEEVVQLVIHLLV
jgi:hypothetical protein